MKAVCIIFHKLISQILVIKGWTQKPLIWIKRQGEIKNEKVKSKD